MIITFIFRKPNPLFYSIERIFFRIADDLAAGGLEVRKLFVPDYGISMRNVMAVRKLRATSYKLREGGSEGERNGERKSDIYHVTGDVHYAVLGLPRRRTVLTIHDCVFLYQTRGLKRWILKKIFLDWPVRYSQVVTTISEATRQDILRNTGCRPEKVVVIPDPVEDNILYSERVFEEKKPVLLFIGSTPNKNLDRVIQALEGIPCCLDIVGEPAPEAVESMERSGIRYRKSSRLSDEEMAAKYAGCDLVIFPSLFEGFGLPILEGQKAGRAVLTSDLSPMKEVAGGAACLVDPHSVDSIRAGILKLIEDRPYREEMVAKGLQNVRRFDREVITEQYLECYKRLIP